jgi:hypothetical protein
MPTLEQTNILQHEVQHVNDDPDHFDAARERVDTTAASIDDPFQHLRFCRLLSTNVITHFEAMTAIEMAEPESDIEVPTGASAYDVYLQHTSDLDLWAAAKALRELTDDHPLTPVYDHFVTQAEELTVVRQQNDETARKLGKVDHPLVIPYGSDGIRSFFVQFTRNAAVTTMDQVVQGAMGIALRHNTLPDPEDITRLLFEDHGFEKILSYSEVTGLLLHRHNKGREASERWSEDSTEKREQRPTDSWNTILRDYVEQGTLSVLTGAIGRFLLQKETVAAKTKMHGHCGGSFRVRPYEPEGGTVKREQAEAFFADRGITLDDGRFSASGYQLARGFAVAKPTILSDPVYRAAIEDIAKGLRESLT